MSFRYRLLDAEGNDLGLFVSKRNDWTPGNRKGRSKGEDMVITAMFERGGDAWLSG